MAPAHNMEHVVGQDGVGEVWTEQGREEPPRSISSLAILFQLLVAAQI